MGRIIYSPPEVGKYTVEVLREFQANRGNEITTGIGSLDRVLLPLRPSELITVLGYTSHYKSGFMNFLTKEAIRQCRPDDIVIKVTWEQSVEEDTLTWIANDSGISVATMVRGEVDWEVTMKSYARRIATPLWIIGHSDREAMENRTSRPRLTMGDVASACEYIRANATDNEYRIRMIVLDYLQRIRPERGDGSTRREQMIEAVNRAKDLAITHACPVVLGVQAGRDILDRAYKLPRLDDGQETSNIEQSSDKVLALWYPIKTERPGSRIEGVPVEVSNSLLIVGVLKQKFAPAPVTLPLYVDPAKNVIATMEVNG